MTQYLETTLCREARQGCKLRLSWDPMLCGGGSRIYRATVWYWLFLPKIITGPNGVTIKNWWKLWKRNDLWPKRPEWSSFSTEVTFRPRRLFDQSDQTEATFWPKRHFDQSDQTEATFDRSDISTKATRPKQLLTEATFRPKRPDRSNFWPKRHFDPSDQTEAITVRLNYSFWENFVRTIVWSLVWL